MLEKEKYEAKVKLEKICNLFINKEKSKEGNATLSTH